MGHNFAYFRANMNNSVHECRIIVNNLYSEITVFNVPRQIPTKRPTPLSRIRTAYLSSLIQVPFSQKNPTLTTTKH